MFTVFNLVLICNLMGLTPYALTITSLIIITFSLGLGLCIGIIFLTIQENDLCFLIYLYQQEFLYY